MRFASAALCLVVLVFAVSFSSAQQNLQSEITFVASDDPRRPGLQTGFSQYYFVNNNNDDDDLTTKVQPDEGEIGSSVGVEPSFASVLQVTHAALVLSSLALALA